MAFSDTDIFCAAKSGDLAAVRYFVETQGVGVNERNFDSTPLFYASLCGHVKVVRYLLERGACCATGTFDGDRALYGALTDEIRSLLRDYAARPTPLSEFAQQLEAMRTQSGTWDVTFKVGSGPLLIRAHRVVLQARIPFFHRQFASNGAWFGRSCIELRKRSLPAVAFNALVRYAYTDTFEVDANCVGDALRLFRACELRALHAAVKTERALASHKPTLQGRRGGSVSRLCLIEPFGSGRLKRDFGPVLESCKGQRSPPPNTTQFRLDADVTVECDDGVQFWCHGALLMARSPYFATMLTGSFSEARFSKHSGKRVRVRGIESVTFEAVLSYLYCDDANFSCVPEADAAAWVDLIDAANQYLLPSLKLRAAQRIISIGFVQTLFLGRQEASPRFPSCSAWLATAYMFDAVLLRDACTSALGACLADALRNHYRGKQGVPLEAGVPGAVIASSHPELAEFALMMRSSESEGGFADLSDRERTFLATEIREALVDALMERGVTKTELDDLVDAFEVRASSTWSATFQ